MNETKIIFLEITSWLGLSLGAQHYYGELVTRRSIWKQPRIKLTHILTPRQAAKLNRDLAPGGYSFWAGEESEGFDSEEEIRELALKTWRTYFPQGEMLIEGKASIGDPQRILDWPASPLAMEEANKVFADFDELRGYEFNSKRSEAERLNKMWDSLLGLEWDE